MNEEFGATGVKAGCCECGQLWMLFNHPQVAENMRQSFAATEAETGEGADVFVCADGIAKCSKCGKVFELPAGEMLDIDRSPVGQWRLGQEAPDGEKGDGLL